MTTKSIAVIRRHQSPRAVAVVLGPLGVSSSSLERLADLYPDCHVVAAASPPKSFMLNRSMKDEAKEILREAGLIIQEKTTLPLVMHSFSNGGAFLLDEVERLLDSDHNFENKDILQSSLKNGCQIYDSCPCYIRMAWDVQNLSSSFPHPSWSTPGRFLYSLGASWSLTVWCASTLAVHHPHRFWARRLDSKHCLHQVYVYSTCDMLSDAAAVDRLIAHRQEKLGVDCKVIRYDDSDHCRMHRDHPQEYENMINAAIEAATKRSGNSSTLD